MPHFLFSYLLFLSSSFLVIFESSGHLWGRTRPLGEARCVLDCVCVCLWERVSLAEVSSPETAEQKGLWLTGLTFPFVLFFLFLSHQLPPPPCPFLNPWGWVSADLQPDSGEKKRENISKDSLGWEKQTPEQPPGADGQMNKSKRERYQRQYKGEEINHL